MNQQLAANAARLALIHLNNRIINSTGPKDLPFWCVSSKPYLRAIADDNYGLEDPKMCVLYALNNLTQWRGEDARMVKLQLKESIK